MFRKDNFFLGIITALICPVIFYSLIFLLNYFLLRSGIARFYLEKHIHVFVSIFGNLVPMRIFFVNLKYDKSGRAVLFITFLTTIAFFTARKYFDLL